MGQQRLMGLVLELMTLLVMIVIIACIRLQEPNDSFHNSTHLCKQLDTPTAQKLKNEYYKPANILNQ